MEQAEEQNPLGVSNMAAVFLRTYTRPPPRFF